MRYYNTDLIYSSPEINPAKKSNREADRQTDKHDAPLFLPRRLYGIQMSCSAALVSRQAVACPPAVVRTDGRSDAKANSWVRKRRRRPWSTRPTLAMIKSCPSRRCPCHRRRRRRRRRRHNLYMSLLSHGEARSQGSKFKSCASESKLTCTFLNNLNSIFFLRLMSSSRA